MERRAFALAFLSVCFSAAVLSIHPITSNDTFWHIACGARILETGAVSRVDEFTFTSSGNPWVNHEYLSDIVFAFTEKQAGLAGVTVLAAAAALAAALCLWKTARIAGGAASSIFPALVPLALFGAVPRLIPRPHIFSIFFVALLSFLLADVERGRRRLLGFFPLILWAWAQLHGEFLIGVVFLLLLSARLAMDRATRKLVFVLLPSPLLLLVGPYGLETFTFPFKLLGSRTFMAAIEEWQPLLAGSPLGQPFAQGAGMLMAVAGVGAAGYLWRRKSLSGTEFLWLLALCVLALKMRRALVYPALAATIPLSRLIAQVLEGKRGVSLLPLVPIPVIVGFLAWGIPTGPGERLPVGFGAGFNIPERAVDFVSTHRIQGKCYNSYTSGAYLTYRLWPRVLTAIDSRNLVYSEEFFEAYRRSLREPTPLREKLLGEADFAFFVAPGLPDATPPILAALGEHPAWHLVYFDDAAFVYLADRRFHEAGGTMSSYRRLKPDTLGFAATNRSEWEEAVGEARSATRMAPASAAAWVLAGRASLQLALLDPPRARELAIESRDALHRALALPHVEVPPDTYYFLARGAELLGDHTAALTAARACLARDPRCAPARELIQRLAGD
jgi:hypothetical protein